MPVRTVLALEQYGQVVFENMNTFPSPTKQVLISYGVPFEALECDINALSEKQKADLQKASGIKTYPNIFIGKTPIGGCDALKKLVSDNKLLKMLKDNNIEVSEDS